PWAAVGLYEGAAATFEEVGERQHLVAMAKILWCRCYLDLGAYIAGRRIAEALIAQSEQGTQAQRSGRTFRAFARMHLGEVDQGIQEMSQEIDLAVADGQAHMASHMRAPFALALLRVGDLEATERMARAALETLVRSPRETIDTLA